jgi:BirA family biotin operon repressor/biotin-[acetyl-CoA-carboxylase] ligase
VRTTAELAFIGYVEGLWRSIKGGGGHAEEPPDRGTRAPLGSVRDIHAQARIAGPSRFTVLSRGTRVALHSGMRGMTDTSLVAGEPASADHLSIDLIRRGLATRDIGFEMHLFDTVRSTNDVAAGLAELGAREGTVVLAEAQHAGRGRFGRPWFSPPHVNLYASVILRPAIAPSAVPVFALIASLAAADAVTGEGVPASVRWPNDVVVSGGRVGATLTVAAADGDVVQRVILGIGVNLNISRDDLARGLGPAGWAATSVSEATGRRIDRNRFTASLLNRLERWHRLYIDDGPEAVRVAWNQRDAVCGRLVEVREDNAARRGRAIGVGERGRLVLESESGEYWAVSGEVTTVDGERIR